MLCGMDDRIGKHSAKSLRIDAQQTMVNVHIGRVRASPANYLNGLPIFNLSVEG